jgi:hypothetical protein
MKPKRYGTVITVLGILAFTGPARRLFLPGGEATLNLLGQPTSQRAAQPRLVEAYGRLPLSFEANQGQTDQRVRFLARGGSYTFFLTGDSAVLALRKSALNGKGQMAKAKTGSQESQFQSTLLKSPASLQFPDSTSQVSATDDGPRTKDTVLCMRVVGANPSARVIGQEELPGKSNYFIGNDPEKWHTNVPNYAKVKYANVYPGVDVVYYGNQGELEYDFVVQPGADPRQIRLQVVAPASSRHAAKMAALHLDANGDLVAGIGDGEVIFHKPVVYQPRVNYEPRTKKQEPRTTNKEVIDGHYLLQGNRLTFEVASYDKTRPLVIDPTLVYSTYLGGSNWDQANGIAVDASGNAYVTGLAFSGNFPTTTGTLQSARGFPVASLAFLSKLNGTGSALIYSTYLGGSNADNEGRGVAVDTSGNAYVTGWTASGNFPTTAGAFQTTFGGGYDDAFVSKLNATGSALVYSTYLGGSSYDEGHGIVVGASGDAYVAGISYSSNFPTTRGAFQTTLAGFDDAFVSKLNPAGSALVYSTYLGGSSYDEGDGIAVDTSGNAHVTGLTHSSDFPTTAGAFQTKPGGGFDAFVSKLNPAGSALFYSTYLGGGSDDFGFGIAVDTSGNAYVTGSTYSSDFPTTAGAFQTTPGEGHGGGYDDAFVVKLNAVGKVLVYSTYLGGGGDDVGYGIAVDTSGNAFVTGATYSAYFPTTAGAFQTTLAGAYNAFLSKMNPAGSALLYSTYLGGSHVDQGRGIAVDESGNAYVAGGTSSHNFPTTAGAFQSTLPGVNGAFVAQMTAR